MAEGLWVRAQRKKERERLLLLSDRMLSVTGWLLSEKQYCESGIMINIYFPISGPELLQYTAYTQT